MTGSFATLDLSPNPIEQSRRRMFAGGGYLDLTSSNPTHHGLFFPADVLWSATSAYLATRRYQPDPHGLPAARAAIARFYAGRTPPLLLSEDALYLTASTSESYGMIFALLAGPGDNFLAPNVTYPLFDYLAEIHHVSLRSYNMVESQDWQVDGASLLAQADERTRGVLLVSPHNPTGMVLRHPVPELEYLGLPLLCDEVFSAFPYAVPHIPPAATLHPTLPVFHLNGISKLFALPDMKLGWIALNPPAQAMYGERLELINDTFLGASSLVQSLLPTMFAQGMGFVSAMAARVRANLDDALERLATCTTIAARPPDGGYYLFPSVQGWDDEEALTLFLLENGVLVHPGYFYGDVPGTHIMISALTEPGVFRQGIERLCNLLP